MGSITQETSGRIRVTVESQSAGSIALRVRDDGSLITIADSTTVALSANDVQSADELDVLFVSDGVSRRVKASVVDPRARVQEDLESGIVILQGHRTPRGWLSLRVDRLPKRLEVVSFALTDHRLVLSVDAFPVDLKLQDRVILRGQSDYGDSQFEIPALIQSVSGSKDRTRYEVLMATGDFATLASPHAKSYSVSFCDELGATVPIGAQSCDYTHVMSLGRQVAELPYWTYPEEWAFDHPHRAYTLEVGLDSRRWLSLGILSSKNIEQANIYPAGLAASLSL